MKVTINTTAPQSREIDWSKPMVVTNGEIFVLTTGANTCVLFSGIDLSNGSDSDRWSKRAFTPCTTPVTITFENEL